MCVKHIMCDVDYCIGGSFRYTVISKRWMKSKARVQQVRYVNSINTVYQVKDVVNLPMPSFRLFEYSKFISSR